MSAANHRRGAATEYRVASYFLAIGYDVWFPANQHSKADLLVEKDGKFQKVQVKTASWCSHGPNEYLGASLSSGKDRHYAADDFSLIAVLDPTEDSLWIIPWEEVPGHAVSLDKRGPTTRSALRSSYDPNNWRVK